jgi:hypothetical protein
VTKRPTPPPLTKTERAALHDLTTRSARTLPTDGDRNRLLRLLELDAADRQQERRTAGGMERANQALTQQLKDTEAEVQRQRRAAENEQAGKVRWRRRLIEAEAKLAALVPIFEGFERLLTTSARDWGEYRVDAWLYAVICGWDCENTEHDDAICSHGALEEAAEQHGWNEEAIAKARRYRDVVRSIVDGQP